MQPSHILDFCCVTSGWSRKLKHVVIAAVHTSDVWAIGWRLTFADDKNSEYLAILADKFGVAIVSLVGLCCW